MRSRKLLIIILAIFLVSFVPEKKKITVWLCGDSTMSIKDPRYYPETGWGMPFANFFDSTVTIENRAKNGRSTKTFISENLWQSVVDNAKEGDYVFIQFGHNDEAKEKVERFTTAEEYRANLLRFVQVSRDRKKPNRSYLPLLLAGDLMRMERSWELTMLILPSFANWPQRKKFL